MPSDSTPAQVRRRDRLRAFARARFDPARYLGLHFTLGILAIALCLWGFVVIADKVHEDESLAQLDSSLAHWLHHRATPTLTDAISALTWLGSPAVVVPLAAVAGFVWWFRQRHARAAFIWLAVFGGLLLNTALKHAFSRARPVWDEPLGVGHGFSFPSGHVAGATLLYGTAALLVLRDARSWNVRLAAAGLLLLLIEAIAFTRLYLGVHYLSDVIAAQAVAGAWLALSATAIDTLRRRRAWLMEKPR